jgi:hypothetical protein
MDERTMGADAYGTWSTDALVGSSVQVWSDHDRIHGLAHHHIWVLSCMDRILWGWGLLVCLFLLRAWDMTCWVLSLRTDHKRLIVALHTIYIFVHVTINYMCCQFHILPTRAGTVSSYEMWQLCPPRSPFIFCVSLTSTIFWWAEDQSQFLRRYIYMHVWECTHEFGMSDIGETYLINMLAWSAVFIESSACIKSFPSAHQEPCVLEISEQLCKYYKSRLFEF